MPSRGSFRLCFRMLRRRSIGLAYSWSLRSFVNSCSARESSRLPKGEKTRILTRARVRRRKRWLVLLCRRFLLPVLWCSLHLSHYAGAAKPKFPVAFWMDAARQRRAPVCCRAVVCCSNKAGSSLPLAQRYWPGSSRVPLHYAAQVCPTRSSKPESQAKDGSFQDHSNPRLLNHLLKILLRL